MQIDLLVVHWFFAATHSVFLLQLDVPFFVLKSGLVLSNDLVLTIFFVCNSTLMLSLQLLNFRLRLLL